jgi:hypothetical protein
MTSSPGHECLAFDVCLRAVAMTGKAGDVSLQPGLPRHDTRRRSNDRPDP